MIKSRVARLSTLSTARWLKPLSAGIVAVLVLAVVVTVLTSGGAEKTVTAHFTRATGLYKGSSVRVLGVVVGKITSIKPEGTTVAVTMSYEASRRIPAAATAVIIPPSLVSDRYVQLGPVYTSGPVMPDKAQIPVTRTEAPVELSTLLQGIDDLSVALGPNGANKSGALSRLLTVSAENLRGNGTQLNSTLKNVAALVSTLADNKDDLTGTINNLATFTNALQHSDGAVRSLTNDLATVSGQLEGDRASLAGALHNLSLALGDVGRLVHDNRSVLTSDIAGLTRITNTLTSQKASLTELLDDAPLALQNLNNVYDPGTQSLRSKNDFEMTENPTLYLCQVVASLTQNAHVCDAGQPLGQVLSGVGGVVGSVTGSGR
jgi:phospholipid/cholesterol/gamma-HCH transport system substrate-binding protein